MKLLHEIKPKISDNMMMAMRNLKSDYHEMTFKITDGTYLHYRMTPDGPWNPLGDPRYWAEKNMARNVPEFESSWVVDVTS